MDQMLFYLINFALIALYCAVYIITVLFCVNVVDTEAFWNSITNVQFYVLSSITQINKYVSKILDVTWKGKLIDYIRIRLLIPHIHKLQLVIFENVV